MLAVLHRLSPDVAAPALLAVTLLLVGFGASGVSELRSVGGPGRWIALAALAAVGCLLLVRERASAPRLGPFAIAVVFLAGLGMVSTAWSATPRLTAGRSVTFAVLVVAVAGLGLAAAQAPALARRLLASVVGAAVILALAGIVLYLSDPGLAVQGQVIGIGARFRGVGENPNTLPMFYALALPAATWLCLSARSLSVRLGWLAAAALLLGSMSASGSRGAMVGAAPACAFVIVLAARGRLAVLAVGTAAALFLIAVAGTTLAKPRKAPPAPAASSAGAVPSAASPTGVPAPSAPDLVVRVDPALVVDPNEIGRPRPGLTGGVFHRTLFGTSGRAQAWDGAIRQSLKRPLLGYGFGSEDRVFIDRYYYYESARVENSYLGLWLQVGLVGLGVFLLCFAILAFGLVRRIRDVRAVPGPLVAGAGIVVSGLVMAVVQSYVYSVGNVATVTFWLGAFLLGCALRREVAL